MEARTSSVSLTRENKKEKGHQALTTDFLSYDKYLNWNIRESPVSTLSMILTLSSYAIVYTGSNIMHISQTTRGDNIEFILIFYISSTHRSSPSSSIVLSHPIILTM